MLKKCICCLLLIFITIIQTGCWDRKELNELGIVMAIGIEKDDVAGRINLISQVVRPSELKKQGGGGKDAAYEIVTTSNDTVFEAIRDTVKEFDRRSIFSHVKVIVISESLARDGVKEIMDFIARSHEIRSFTWIVIAKDSDAKSILSVKHGIEKIQANYMDGIIKREVNNADVSTSNFINFFQKMPGEGINPVTGAFLVTDETKISEDSKTEHTKALTLFGTAVFKKDKLVGFLDDYETNGFNLITQKKKSKSLHVESPQNKNKHISIEIRSSSNKIKTELRNGKICFDVSVKVSGNITEVEDDIDVTNVEIFDKVNENFKKYIEKEVHAAVDKVQKDLKTDIFGFGNAFQRKYPKEWNSIKDQWDNIFPDTVCEINVDTKLVRTGLFLKPLDAQKVDEK
jgi:germination protein, Ger(x)C family